MAFILKKKILIPEDPCTNFYVGNIVVSAETTTTTTTTTLPTTTTTTTPAPTTTTSTTPAPTTTTSTTPAPTIPIPFIATFDTTLDGTPTELQLPLVDDGTYDFDIDWGDGNIEYGFTTWDDARKLHTYGVGGVYTIRISGQTEGWNFASDTHSRRKILEISQWGNGIQLDTPTYNSHFFYFAALTGITASDNPLRPTTEMAQMFFVCNDLAYVNSTNWDTSNVTNMGQAFHGCNVLIDLDTSNWDTSNVQNFGYTFGNCGDLEFIDVSGWDTSSAVSMWEMFGDASSIDNIDVSTWDVSNVSNPTRMFLNCLSLTYLDVSNWVLTATTSLFGMFQNCYVLDNLDISTWDVSNISNFQDTFSQAYALTGVTVYNWDIGSATDMTNMFLNVQLSTSTYDQILINWNNLPSKQSGVVFNGGDSEYTSGGAAETARNNLISNDSWVITDGGIAP